MKKLFDLRFVIGTFFAIVGFLLLLNAFLEDSKSPQDINRVTGIIFLVFGMTMIGFSFRKNRRDGL